MIKKPSVKDRAFMAGANLPNIPPTAVGQGGRADNRTAPGAMLQHLAKESQIFGENKRLKDELNAWEGASPTRKIEATCIVRSRWGNRHEDSFRSPEFLELKDEIESSGGNVQPIVVRPVPGESPQVYEVVFGHRRHQACLDLGLPVLAMVQSMDDRALFETMDRENRQRADLRPYEQGEMYRRALDSKLYPSLRMLAEAIGLDPGNVSRAMKIARLPDCVLNAFPSRLDIQYRWALPLADATEREPEKTKAIAETIIAARAAKGDTLSAVDVFEALTQAPRRTAAEPVVAREVMVHGKTVATIRQTNGRHLIEFKKDAIPPGKLASLDAVIAQWLE